MMTVKLVGKTWLGAVLAAAALVPATAQAAGWAPAMEPFDATPISAPPLLAANADGDLVLASGDGHVTTRPAGGAFTAPVALPGARDVAINKAGDVAVAWFAGDAVHYTVRPSGGDFGAVHDVPSPGDAFDAPSIAIDDAGDVALAWMERRPDIALLHYSVFAPDGSITAAGTSSLHASVYFDLAADGAGNVVVAYAEQSGTGITPVAAVRAAGGTTFTAAPLGAPFSSSLMPRLDAAVDDAGHATVAFESGVGDIAEVHAAYGPAGGAFGPELVVSAPGVSSVRPTIAVGASGDVAVTWTDPRLYLARARTGRFGQPFTAPITEFASGPGRPSVAVAPSGRTVATWSGQGTDGKNLFSAVREPGGSLVEQPAIGPGPAAQALDQHFTPVAMDAEGDAFAAWWTGDRIELAVDDVGAPRLRDLAIPETGVVDHAVPLSVTATDGGSTPSVRWDFGDGTTGPGASVGHIYLRPGAYDVRVTATDGAGHAVSTTRRIAIGVTPTDPQPPVAAPKRCKVPKLTGRSYVSAKARLTSAHCRIGRAKKPKGHKTTKNLVVARQSRKAGTVTRAGAKVDVVLRVKQAPKRR
jgi:hypothetical protein